MSHGGGGGEAGGGEAVNSGVACQAA
jgi:hypothetical protein